MSRGRSLELYFVDGTPDGILTAEVFGWTGHVLRIPRLQLAEALKRPEALHTGAYILLGELNDRQRAYIGEAERVARRIKDHDTGKDWWREVLILTTSGDHLHKAHVRYLEARLVKIAREAGNVDLDNSNDPIPASLTEAQQANMEEFLDTLQMVLPALGVGLLQTGRRNAPLPLVADMLETSFILTSAKTSTKAGARLEGSDFIVRAGSGARPEWVGGAGHAAGYRGLRAKLISDGVLRQAEGNHIFTQDFACASPSAAAAVILGRSANGRTEWREETSGRSFSEWETEQLKDLPI